ncbi:MAG TPA: hypothetical protein VGE38_14525 [Nocardioides sp.]|uniref:DUF6907 domain-containing protein n=1 Tax=Nocardioides sp. TaxID=35761 RepID=UPI002ED8F92C
MTTPDQPVSWLREHCPAWCARAHEESDHPEDRYHQSEPCSFPILASVPPTVPIASSLQAVDMVVRVCRYPGELVEWIAVEAAEQRAPRLVLTTESARRLAECLAAQLRPLAR